MRFVLLLGAGASASEGAPLQSELFASYFAAVGDRELDAIGGAHVVDLFDRVFGIDIRELGAEAALPTFEEVLGTIDLSLARGESLRGLASRDRGDSVDLQSLRKSVVLVLAAAIRRRIPGDPTHHARLIEALRESRALDRATFISTNYDTLIDAALYDGPGVDYGFKTVKREDDSRPIGLFKIHGSLNWLYCPVCTDLTVTFGRDIVARLLEEPATTRCTRCDIVRQPVIVPPTYYKDLSNVFLADVWNRAAAALREARLLIVSGYSMPDADMHIKYLIKAAQLNRGPADDPLRIVLVNSHSRMDPQEHRREVERYARFFGRDAVRDASISFEQFVVDPMAVVG